MSRPIAARRRAPEVAAGAAGTALIHVSLLALLIGGIKTAPPMAPVYAVELVAAKSPADLTAFKGFLLGIAQATADAVKGVSDHEATAIARLQDVLF